VFSFYIYGVSVERDFTKKPNANIQLFLKRGLFLLFFLSSGVVTLGFFAEFMDVMFGVVFWGGGVGFGVFWVGGGVFWGFLGGWVWGMGSRDRLFGVGMGLLGPGGWRGCFHIDKKAAEIGCFMVAGYGGEVRVGGIGL